MQLWFVENQTCQNAGMNTGEEHELTHVLIILISYREHNLLLHIELC